jgi:NAD(P)-dependent dehydrogenase (short-subunit alcohol dehydrogenase family)
MKQGHVSIIAGGSRGIGQSVARALAARGGNVFVIGRNRQRVEETVKHLAALGMGQHFGLVLDVSNPDDMAEMAASCAERFGRIDLLVFCAAVSGYEDITKIPPQVLDLPLAAWCKALDVNLHGAFLANRAVLPLMIRQGEGNIINISSALTPRGLRGRAHAAAYSATKFALAAFTHSLASEVSEHGIRVNVVFPGAVSTPLIEGTTLAREFGSSMTSEHFAQALVRLLDFPIDCVPVEPYVLPMMGIGSAVQSQGTSNGKRS